METMGDRIRTMRKSRTLTQDDVAKIMGVSAAAVSQWENGNIKDLKIENFLRFCAYFNCDPQWLAFGDVGAPWDKTPPSTKTG